MKVSTIDMLKRRSVKGGVWGGKGEEKREGGKKDEKEKGVQRIE